VRTIKTGRGGIKLMVFSTDGHQLVNRSSQPAVYLEISNRDPQDKAFYSEADLIYQGAGAKPMFTRKDGSYY